MSLPAFRRLRPSQAVLFAPAAMLLVLGLTVARNSLTRSVLHAEDSPDGKREALIFIDYSPAYPFTGHVEAHMEMRRLPGHEVIFSRPLGRHRWYSEASAAFRSIEWNEPGRVTLHSGDGSSRALIYSPRLLQGEKDR